MTTKAIESDIFIPDHCYGFEIANEEDMAKLRWAFSTLGGDKFKKYRVTYLEKYLPPIDVGCFMSHAKIRCPYSVYRDYVPHYTYILRIPDDHCFKVGMTRNLLGRVHEITGQNIADRHYSLQFDIEKSFGILYPSYSHAKLCEAFILKKYKDYKCESPNINPHSKEWLRIECLDMVMNSLTEFNKEHQIKTVFLKEKAIEICMKHIEMADQKNIDALGDRPGKNMLYRTEYHLIKKIIPKEIRDKNNKVYVATNNNVTQDKKQWTLMNL